MSDLETKLTQPDWKQWLPFYGIYAARKAINEGRPSLALKYNPQTGQDEPNLLTAVYHGIMGGPVAYGVGYALLSGLNQLFS